MNAQSKYFEVKKHNYVKQAQAIELGYYESVPLLSTPQHFDVTYSQFPADPTTVNVVVNPLTSATLSNVKAYSDRVEFDISGTDGDSSFVTITGKAYDDAVTVEYAGDSSFPKETIENTLIGEELASDVIAHQQDINAKNVYEFEVMLGAYADLTVGAIYDYNIGTSDTTVDTMLCVGVSVYLDAEKQTHNVKMVGGF